MSKDKNHINQTLSPEQIEKYLNGQLNHEQMHEVEKLMLNSDFDSEAMDGFEDAGITSISSDMSMLQEKLLARTEPTDRPAYPWLKIAAAILLLAVSTIILLNTDLLQSNKEMAHSETIEQDKAAPYDDNDSEPEQKANTPLAEDTLIAMYDSEITENESEANDRDAGEVGAMAVPDNQDETISIEEELAEKEMEDIEPVLIEEDLQLAEVLEAEELAEPLADEPAEDYITSAPANNSVEERLQGKAAGVQIESKPTKQRAKKAEIAASKVTARGALAGEVSGKVTSSDDGSALPGVNVMLKGTTIGTVTDLEGNYNLTLPDNADPVLVVSFIGLNSMEVEIANRSTINVEMEPDVSQLSEVVVTALGVERERSALGYSVQTVDPDPSRDDRADIVPAQPEGGKAAYKDYIQANAKPINGVEGKVILSFEVTASGNLVDFKIIKSQGDLLDNEAIRIIKEGPKWSPALRNDTPHQDRVRVRVKFQQ